jgi:glycosyltransferase involved in cell wall biosynthesis
VNDLPRAAPEISLVIPVYNEEESLEILAAEIRAALATNTAADYEVLFVDDGSRDRSAEILARLRRDDPRIRVLRQKSNAGQSAAFDAGFRFARGRVVVTLDSDLQNDPADIPRLVAALDGADVVCGVRANRRDTWVRRASSRIANAVRNRLTHDRVTDTGCSLKAFRAERLQRLPMFNGMHRFLPTLLRMDGARIVELPVNHRPRRYGVAKYGIGNRLFRALADLFAVRWMQRRWIDRSLTEEAPASDRPSPRA